MFRRGLGSSWDPSGGVATAEPDTTNARPQDAEVLRLNILTNALNPSSKSCMTDILKLALTMILSAVYDLLNIQLEPCAVHVVKDSISMEFVAVCRGHTNRRMTNCVICRPQHGFVQTHDLLLQLLFVLEQDALMRTLHGPPSIHEPGTWWRCTALRATTQVVDDLAAILPPTCRVSWGTKGQPFS